VAFRIGYLDERFWVSALGLAKRRRFEEADGWLV
jgi:hypothetical protein